MSPNIIVDNSHLQDDSSVQINHVAGKVMRIQTLQKSTEIIHLTIDNNDKSPLTLTATKIIPVTLKTDSPQ